MSDVQHASWAGTLRVSLLLALVSACGGAPVAPAAQSTPRASAVASAEVTVTPPASPVVPPAPEAAPVTFGHRRAQGVATLCSSVTFAWLDSFDRRMPRGTLSTDQFRYQLQDELTISRRFSVSQGADLQLGVERVRILSAGRTAIGGTTELRFASSSAIEGKQFVLSGDPVKVVSGTGRAVPAAEAGEAAALSAVFRELPSKLPVGSVEVGVVEKALAQPLALHVASMLQPFTGVLPRVEATAAAVDEVKLGDGVAVVVLSFEARMTWPKAKLPWEATVKGTAELRADDGLVVSTFTRGDISATDEENRGWEGGRFDVGTKCVHEWGDGADGSEKVTGSSSR